MGRHLDAVVRHAATRAPSSRTPKRSGSSCAATTPSEIEIAEVDDYPAHLHIDLLPAAQGQGWGTKLIGRLRSELADVGVPGVFASLDAENVTAPGFYDKIGFTELPSSTPEAPSTGSRRAPERT